MKLPRRNFLHLAAGAAATPPAAASRVRVTSWLPRTQPSRPPASAGGYCSAATLTPASPALHAALRVALASAAMMPGGVAMYGFDTEGKRTHYPSVKLIQRGKSWLSTTSTAKHQAS